MQVLQETRTRWMAHELIVIFDFRSRLKINSLIIDWMIGENEIGLNPIFSLRLWPVNRVVKTVGCWRCHVLSYACCVTVIPSWPWPQITSRTPCFRSRLIISDIVFQTDTFIHSDPTGMTGWWVTNTGLFAFSLAVVLALSFHGYQCALNRVDDGYRGL